MCMLYLQSDQQKSDRASDLYTNINNSGFNYLQLFSQKTSVFCKVLLFLLILTNFSKAQFLSRLPQETIFENGLTVVSYEMHHAPVIFMGLVYDAAPRNEYIGITGMSHMVEHMMFMGTENYPGDEFLNQMRRAGAGLNGFTTADFTAFFEFFPKKEFEKMLKMESDRLYRLSLDSTIFEKERKVVRNERLRKLDNSARAKMDWDFKNLFYRTHPYRNPTIGYMQDINNYTIEKVRHYYQSYYRPERATLIVVGDFDTAEMLPLVKKYFSAKKEGALPIEIPVFELKPEGKRTVRYQHSIIKNPEIRFHFHLPPVAHQDAPALDALMFILGRPSSNLGILKEKLVETQKIAKSAGTAGFSFRDAGFMSIKIQTEDSLNFSKIKQSVNEIFQYLKSTEIAEKDLFAYKLKKKYIRANLGNSIQDMGEKLIYYIHQGGWQYKLSRELELQFALTPADIRRAAEKYLNWNECFIEYRLPADQKNSGIEPSGKKQDNFCDTHYFLPEEDQPNGGSFSINSQIKKTILENGITVYQLKNPAIGLWHMMGFWETGEISENKMQPGLGRLFVQAMSSGTEKTDKSELKKKMSYYQLRQHFGGGNIDFSCSGEALVEYADTLMNIFSERLFYPKFEQKFIDEFVEKNTQTAEAKLANHKAFASEEIIKIVFPDHPYSRPNKPEAGEWHDVNPELLYKMRKKYLRPENLTLFITGPVDEKENIRLIKKYFDRDWHNTGTFESNAVPINQTSISRNFKLIENENQKVNEIRIAFPGPDYNSGQALAFDMVSRILSRGSVSSYLGKILRHKLGLTYYIGINGASGAKNFGGSLIIQSQVLPENTDQFLAEFKRLIAAYPDYLTEEIWSDYRNRIISGYPKQWDDFEKVSYRIYNQLREGHALPLLDNYIERLNSITVQDLKKLAAEYISTEKMYVLVVGKK